MAELERDLRALAAEIDYPPTPDLAARVGSRLRAPAPGPAGWRLGRALAIAGLALLAAAGTAFAASSDFRDAVLDALGLSGVAVERTSQPPPDATARDLGLGPSVALSEAAEALSFRPLVPQAGGAPDGVHVRDDLPGGELTLVYEPRADLPPTTTTGAGLLVTEFRGGLMPEYLGKIAPEATRIERLRIEGHRAVWISGAPHFFFFRDPGGVVHDRELLAAQNVLLIRRGPVLVRMEGAFDRATAVRLGGTLAPLGL